MLELRRCGLRCEAELTASAGPGRRQRAASALQCSEPTQAGQRWFDGARVAVRRSHCRRGWLEQWALWSATCISLLDGQQTSPLPPPALTPHWHHH